MENNNNAVNVYYDGGSQFATLTTTTYANGTSGDFLVWGGADYGVAVSPSNGRKNGIHPILAFKYIKKKFAFIEGYRIKSRLKKLEKAFYKAAENGQDMLADKIIKELSIQTRESFIYAKGIKSYIEKSDLDKVKHQVRDGHISDTKLEHYTRVIPKSVLKKKAKVDKVFDGFVIYHYYNPEVEEKLAKKQKMSEDEKSKMKDPILFGYIKENNRLYFIDDWDDEYCDLSFNELCSVVAEGKITKYPSL